MILYGPKPATPLLDEITATRGAMLFRGSAAWAGLTGTSGQFLKSNGAGADPSFATVAGGGDMLAANNLSDVASVSTSKTNLGLAAVASSGAAADVSGLAAVATTGSAASLSTGTLLAARMPALTGDVTTSAGAVATALGNIPTATTMAGTLLATNIAAPSTPASGHASIYVDSTSLALASKDANGNVGHVVRTKAAVASNFLTAIADTGVVSAAQPTASDVTGLATVATSGSAADLSTGTLLAARMPALSGDITTSAGAVATSLTANAVTNAALRQSTALTVIGRSANSTGNVADIATVADGDVLRRSGTTLGFGGIAASAMPALTGDVTTSAGAVATTIAAAAVTLAKMANLAAQTIVGRATGAGTGVPTALTPAQVVAMIFGGSTLVSDGSSGSTKTIDWTAGIMHTVTMTANCTIAFTAPSFVTRVELTVIQDSTPRTITWPASVQWPGGIAPTLSAGSGAVDIIAFSYDGTHYRGIGSTGTSGAFA